MVHELNELKWLLLPLYPFLVLLLFGAWIMVRFKRSDSIHVAVSMFGLRLELSARDLTKEDLP